MTVLVVMGFVAPAVIAQNQEIKAPVPTEPPSQCNNTKRDTHV